MLSIDTQNVNSILLAHTGWEQITPGSLTIDTLQLMPEPGPDVPEGEDYGFTAIASNGRITGRMSVLLAAYTPE